VRWAGLLLATGLLGAGFILAIHNFDSSGLALGLASVLVGLPLLVRWIHGDRELNRFLYPILVWEICLVIFHLLWLVPFYASAGMDALGYYDAAVQTASSIRAGDWESVPMSIGNQAVIVPTAILYALFGPSMSAMFGISAMIGLAGVIAFYKAFAIWQPSGRARLYALVVLFLPSLGVWRSLFGKDSVVILGLGVACLGYSKWLARGRFSALVYTALGVVIAGAVRPHIGFVLVGSLVATEIWRRNARRGSFFVKLLLGVVVFAPLLATVGTVAGNYVALKGQSVDAMLEVGLNNGRGNATGGSVLVNPEMGSLLDYVRFLPDAMVRLLFRPFPWEAHNANAMLATLENVLLFGFLLRSLKSMGGVLRNVRHHPYFLFSLLMVLELSVMFSLLTNLGLISRMKAQIYPFLFTLLLAAPHTARSAQPAAIRRPALRGWSQPREAMRWV